MGMQVNKGRSTDRSRAMFAEAQQYLAGGVSTGMRAAARPHPLFFARAEGPYMYDVDSNRYVDHVLGWGPQILGHSHPEIVAAVQKQAAVGQTYGAQHEGEIRVARRLCELIPCADLVAFSNTGTEADGFAVRLARAATGRPLVMRFEGHYHGWADGLFTSYRPPLDEAGPSAAPHTVPGTLGQSPGAVGDVIVAPWNDAAAVKTLLDKHRGWVAALIMEPYAMNNGLSKPQPGFLEEVRRLTQEHGVVLIFDEVITGFRVGLQSAQGRLGVIPDLAVFGKAVAAGFPLSVIAGRRELMDLVARRQVAHVGTFNGNPVVLAAAEAALDVLSRPGTYERLETLGARLAEGLRAAAASAGIDAWVEQVGAVAYMHLRKGPAHNYRDLTTDDDATYLEFTGALAERGSFTTPRGLWYVSTAHTEIDVDFTCEAAADSLQAVIRLNG